MNSERTTSLGTIHHSPTTIHHSPTTIHHSPTTIHHSPITAFESLTGKGASATIAGTTWLVGNRRLLE
ncbi:MAG TPA: hypothetical protein PLV70_13625, partial [Flavobacteriales bacterium]|nr:hypothetical protein [Flavobacteriales bacterium]